MKISTFPRLIGDIQDELVELSYLPDEIAIVITGNTATQNIEAGNFVVVKNSTISGILDGLYKAVNNITANTAVTSADLDGSATGKGGLNAIWDIIKRVPVNPTWETGKTPSYQSIVEEDGIVIFSVYYTSISFTTNWVDVGTMPAGFHPASHIYVNNGLGGDRFMFIGSDGSIKVKANAAASNQTAAFNVTYTIA